MTSEGTQIDQFIHDETFRAEALNGSRLAPVSWAYLSSTEQGGFLSTFVAADLSHGTSNGFLAVSDIVASPTSRTYLAK